MSDLLAWTDEPINWDEYEEITLALLDDRGREVDRADAEAYPGHRRMGQAHAAKN